MEDALNSIIPSSGDGLQAVTWVLDHLLGHLSQLLAGFTLVYLRKEVVIMVRLALCLLIVMVSPGLTWGRKKELAGTLCTVYIIIITFHLKGVSTDEIFGRRDMQEDK